MDFQKELIAEYDREVARTRKMLEAIPADADFTYKPHPKSMSLGRLAGHLTDMTGDWALEFAAKDKLEFPADHKWEQYVPASKAALWRNLTANCRQFARRWPGYPAAKWDEHWQFIFGGHVWIDQPRCQVFREMVISH